MNLDHVIVIDFETTHADPTEAAIVEIGAVRIYDNETVGWFETLVDPGMDIPLEAMAVHHIKNEDVEEKPRIADAEKMLLEWIQDAAPFAAHNAKYEIAVAENMTTLDMRKTLCTMRIAQHMWPELGTYNLQYLRYARKLDSAMRTRNERSACHSALADADIAAKLLIQQAKELTQIQTFDELHEYCWSPIEVKICPFRKHKGQEWKDVPSDYILWCLGNIADLDPDLKASMKKALQAR